MRKIIIIIAAIPLRDTGKYLPKVDLIEEMGNAFTTHLVPIGEEFIQTTKETALKKGEEIGHAVTRNQFGSDVEIRIDRR